MIVDIFKLLEDSTVDNERYLYYLNGTDELPSLSNIIKKEYNNLSSFSDENAWECITTCMEYYLDDCQFSNSIKKKIRRDFVNWLRNIAFDLKISNDILTKSISVLVAEDATIGIIKELHYSKEKRITKSTLAQKLQISEKTAKDIINKLDKNNHKNELKIAGQKVVLDIDSEYKFDTELGVRSRYFSAKSTVNPVFLQFNISQIFTLLNGCKCSYSSEDRNMSLYVAMEIWDQLSDYTKSRIKSFYGKKDSDFADFLADIEAELSSYEIHSYKSDREQINEMDLKDEEIAELNDKLNY